MLKKGLNFSDTTIRKRMNVVVISELKNHIVMIIIDIFFKSYIAFCDWLCYQVVCCNNEYVCHAEECSRLYVCLKLASMLLVCGGTSLCSGCLCKEEDRNVSESLLHKGQPFNWPNIKLKWVMINT